MKIRIKIGVQIYGIIGEEKCQFPNNKNGNFERTEEIQKDLGKLNESLRIMNARNREKEIKNVRTIFIGFLFLETF